MGLAAGCRVESGLVKLVHRLLHLPFVAKLTHDGEWHNLSFHKWEGCHALNVSVHSVGVWGARLEVFLPDFFELHLL